MAFVVNKVALGQVFSKYFGFVMSVSYQRLDVPHTHTHTHTLYIHTYR